MSLILDHINGEAQDHRLENLQIVCPNCAATLETHCGRNVARARDCRQCGASFRPKYASQKFCSKACGDEGKRRDHGPKPDLRKVERPPYEELMAEIRATSYLAVGRKYGVSDNAVRKWVRWYEEAAERERRAA
ncbi:MAG: hypothetical protein H0V29_07410 [Thermoleophilaceae bacterium]|nr:hypothetical protein [Thermoleophilaceae bacterium]